MKKLFIFLLLNLFFGTSIKLFGQSSNILESLMNQIGGKNAIQSDYDNGKKWVAYIALPGVRIDASGTKAKMKVLIDLADIAGITQEGRDGWITIWVDISALQEIEFGKLFPMSFGLQLRSFDLNTPDSPQALFDIATNLNIPVTPVDLLKCSTNGEIKTVEVKLGMPTSISVSESFTIHGLSFEMNFEILNNLLLNSISPEATLIEFSTLCINFLSCPAKIFLNINPFIPFRFATLDDNPMDTRIQNISSTKLVQGKEGIVNVTVNVKTADYYYLRVWGTDPITAYIPKWDWYSKSSEVVYLEANKNYIFPFYVTPDTRSDDFSFWLYQKEEDKLNIENYKIIEKIRTTIFSAPVGTDVEPPTVYFTSPKSGSNVQNQFQVFLNAYDFGIGLSRIDLFINGNYLESRYEEPFDFSVNTFNLEVGNFELTARAYDKNGNGMEDILTLYNPIKIIPTILISKVQLNKSAFTPGEEITLDVTLANSITDASVKVTVDGSLPVSCNSLGDGKYQCKFNALLQNGKHLIKVFATKTGYVDATPYETSYEVAGAGFTVKANPTELLLNQSSSEITATLIGPDGKPMPGINVNFLQSPAGESITQKNITTDANGIATTYFTPNVEGTFTIKVTAQTVEKPAAYVQVKVGTGNTGTYNIKLTSLITNRTNTSTTIELDPYVTYTSNGLPVEDTKCFVTTNTGIFQNGTQTYTETLGNSGGSGRLWPIPILTVTENGTAQITITVGKTVAVFKIPVTIGPVPVVQPFYTLTDGTSTDDTEHELDWSFDGKMFAYTPGKIVEFPSFKKVFNGPVENTYSLSFSKTGKNLVLGCYSDNPVFYVYNTESKEIKESDPSNVTTNSVVWSKDTDEKKFALANTFTGYMNQIIIYTGDGLSRSYLNIDGTSDIILSIDWKGNYLAATTSGGSVYLFNTSTMSRIWKSTIDRPFKNCVSISPDMTKVAVIGRKYSGYNNLYIFGVTNGTPLKQYGLGDANGHYYSVDWSPVSKNIVCGGNDGTSGYIKIINPDDGNEVFNLVSGTTEEIYGVRWSSTNIIAAIHGSTVKFYAPYDNNGPDININHPLSGITTKFDTVHFKANISDLTGIKAAEFSINSNPYQPLTLDDNGYCFVVMQLDQIKNEIKVKVTDRVGNISEKTLTVNKNTGYLDIDKNSIRLENASGSSDIIALTTNQIWTVTITNNIDWLEITPSSGTGDQNITLKALTTNPLVANRSTTALISSGELTKILTVTQDGQCNLSVSTETISVTAQITNSEFKIESNSEWTITDDADWITASPENGINDGNISLSILPNQTINTREGTVTINGCNSTKTIIVTQEPANGLYGAPFANAGSDQTVYENEIVTLDGSASTDPENDALTYKWTPSTGIILSSETDEKPTFTAPDVTIDAEFKFSLIVNDGNSDSPVDEVIVTVQNINLNEGLAAYYPFNGNANDESGNGHHGTVEEATLTIDRFGNENRAYNFNGINNRIITTFTPTNINTISLWFNAESEQPFNSGLFSTYN